MPVVRAYFEEMLGRKAEMGVDPMECVAAGAAIQAGVLEGVGGAVGEILLVDVTPLTLGVETLGGVATPLIARNTPVPVRKSELFTTSADLQTSVTVHVFQGERPMARDNVGLGEFNLDGLAPAPRGVPKIEVTFDIDASGILDVTAKDSVTGKAQSIRISGSTRLPAAEKERMVKEAEKYAEEDRRRREQADQLNDADAICYQGERFVADFGPKVATDVRKALEAQIAELKGLIGKKDAAGATAKAQALKAALQQAGATIYREAGAAAGAQARPGASGAAGGAKSGEGAATASGQRVVDAQFRDTK
jgi:molecular chaperone DnaK